MLRGPMSTNLKSIAIGDVNFASMIADNSLYVDKTSSIEQLIKDKSKTVLFTRPRRFGKTLSLDMLRCFLEMNYENPKDKSFQENLFKDLEIFKNQEFCANHMGHYPVIYLSFKDVKGSSYKLAIEMIKSLYNDIFRTIDKIGINEERSKLNFDLKQLKELCALGKPNLCTTDDEAHNKYGIIFTTFIKLITQALYDYFKIPPIVLIDEYDVPLQKARENNYYDLMQEFISSLFSQGLKDNKSLSKGILTGCLRVSKESIFTGFNNLKIYSIDNLAFADFFGFTEAEVKELLAYYGLQDNFAEIKSWYDGYTFGTNEIYNPWSVLNYVNDALEARKYSAKFSAQSYWVNTSGNSIILDFVKYADEESLNEMQELLDGNTITKPIRLELSYRDLKNHSIDDLWSLLYASGYLTKSGDVEDNLYTLRIPNNKILERFKQDIHKYFFAENENNQTKSKEILNLRTHNETKKLETLLNELMERFIGVRDKNRTHEYLFHMFLNGIFSMTLRGKSNDYGSNQEAGDGFADIKFRIKDIGIIIELKNSPNYGKRANLCNDALEQCKSKEYYRQFLSEDEGLSKVYLYGIAFCERSCLIKSEEIIVSN